MQWQRVSVDVGDTLSVDIQAFLDMRHTNGCRNRILSAFDDWVPKPFSQKPVWNPEPFTWYST